MSRRAPTTTSSSSGTGGTNNNQQQLLAQGVYFKPYHETFETLNCTSIDLSHLIERLKTLNFEPQMSVSAQVALNQHNSPQSKNNNGGGQQQPLNGNTFRDSVKDRLNHIQNISRQLERPISSFPKIVFQPGQLADALDDLIDSLEEELTESKSEVMNRKNVDLCANFLRGQCVKGVTCSFSHTKESMDQAVHKWVARTGLKDPHTQHSHDNGITLAVREPFGPEAHASMIDYCRERERFSYLRMTQNIQSVSPISVYCVREVTRSSFPVITQVIAGGYLSHLKYVDLSKNYLCREYPKAVLALAKAIQRNGTVEGYSLGFNALGTAGALAILNAVISSPHRSVKTLNLESNGITFHPSEATAFMHFADAVANASFGLEKLCLGGNELGHEGCRRLCHAFADFEAEMSFSEPLPSVMTTSALEFSGSIRSGTPATQEAAAATDAAATTASTEAPFSVDVPAVFGLPTLKYLDLSNCNLMDAGLESLAGFIKNTHTGRGLVYLNIGWNKCGSEGLAHLGTALQGATVFQPTNALLSSGGSAASPSSSPQQNKATAAQQQQNFEDLATTGAQQPSRNNNAHQHQQQQLTVASLLPPTPQLLSLRANFNLGVGRKGAVHLSTLLKNNATLTHLDLRWNGLTEDGMGSLFEGLQSNRTLKFLQCSLGNGKMDSAMEDRLKERVTMLNNAAAASASSAAASTSPLSAPGGSLAEALELFFKKGPGQRNFATLHEWQCQTVW